MKKEIYEAPHAEVVEVYSEGVFCISGIDSQDNESYEYETFEW